jgi:hypothetical protein
MRYILIATMAFLAGFLVHTFISLWSKAKRDTDSTRILKEMNERYMKKLNDIDAKKWKRYYEGDWRPEPPDERKPNG